MKRRGTHVKHPLRSGQKRKTFVGEGPTVVVAVGIGGTKTWTPWTKKGFVAVYLNNSEGLVHGVVADGRQLPTSDGLGRRYIAGMVCRTPLQ